MKECQECGYAVSKSYWRVFTDDDGRLISCPNCGRDGMIDGVLDSPGPMNDKGEVPEDVDHVHHPSESEDDDAS